MSCKNHGWHDCKDMNDKKWENVCYYKCKDNGCGHKKCGKEIAKTKDLIDNIKDKNDKLGDDLKSAKQNQKEANEAVKSIEDNADNLGKNLKEIKDSLCKAFEDLRKIMNDLDKAIPAQDRALDDIKDAKEKQKDIKGLIDELDKEFEDTVKCLKKKESCPVLIPWDECDGKPEKPCKYDHGCDY